MPDYHQTGVVIDVTRSAVDKPGYQERVMKFLESVNRPETMKANVYLVTDHLVHILLPKHLPNWSKYNSTDDIVFNPTAAVKNIKTTYKHHIMIIISPSEHAELLGFSEN